MTDMEERSWHSLSVDEALGSLTSSKNGLSPEEARKRLAQFGPNELRKEKTVSWCLMRLGQFKNVLIIILLVLARLGLGLALGGMGSTASTAIMQGYSLGTQLGILLPYSRTQESEADHVGLILMAKAGYDPAQALGFWKRMMIKDQKGAKLPEFMSTHPNDASRLRELEAFLPEARKYSAPAHEAHSPPPPGPPPAAPAAPGAPVAGRWIPAPQ
mgnify:CR=1 FL=1